jgi:hypothetical protein
VFLAELLVKGRVTPGFTSDTGEVIRYRAINRWDDTDEFDERARPEIALTPEARRIVGVTNELLAGCRPSEVVPGEFIHFLVRRDPWRRLRTASNTEPIIV